MSVSFGQLKISCKFGKHPVKMKMTTTAEKFTYSPMVSSDGCIMKTSDNLTLLIKQEDK